MIKKYNYVFVLGAGSSIPYTFPSGNDLYYIVKDNVEKYAMEYKRIKTSAIRYNPNNVELEAKEFSKALGFTEGISIDKYININKKFEKIGIRAMVSAIIDREKIKNLPIYKRNINDNWYSYLFQKMIEGLNTADDLLDIFKNEISFITFNYDRSLEEYLYLNLHGLLGNSGKSEEEITNSIRKIEILHVYGQAGLLPWQIEDKQSKLILEYENYSGTLFENAERISSLIEVMYSKREISTTINTIRERIAQADRILFLGFGFDDDNIRLLGFPLKDSKKTILGTAFEKTQNEILNYENKLFTDNRTIMHARCLFDCNSTKLLKEYLV